MDAFRHSTVDFMRLLNDHFQQVGAVNMALQLSFLFDCVAHVRGHGIDSDSLRHVSRDA
eukprot:gene14360-16755_t